MRHSIFSTAALVLAVLSARPAIAEDPVESAPATSECVSPPGEPRPPAYPQGAADVSGRVLLEIAIDTCGAPLSVTVAESSGNTALDNAAVEAARTWRLRTDGEGGRVPGFVADHLPLGYATVADAKREVMPIGSTQPSFDENFDSVLVIDEEGLSTWAFAKPRTDFWPTAVRQRAVGDGTRGFWVTSVLCESTDRVACAALKDWMTTFPEQKDAPPPPSAQ
jgi:TonB family protein